MSHITLNDYIFNRYDKIGRGSSGVVYLGYHKNTRDKVAIKRIDIDQLSKKMSQLWKEIEIMKELKHENIVSLYDVYIDIKNDYLYLIMEHCDNDLSDYIREFTLDLDEIHLYMKQLKDGLNYLNENNIVHRDLKPQNILLKNKNVKIADFGLSTNTEQNDLMQTMCGSPLYMSPEIIEHQKYTAKSDLWSIGIILYQLVYHKHPFQNCTNFTELSLKIKKEQITYPDIPKLDSLTIDLFEGLLNKNCHNRISWEDFFDHPWFKHPPTTKIRIDKPFNVSMDMSESELFNYEDSIIHVSDDGKNKIPENNNLNLSKYVVNNYNKTPAKTINKVPNKNNATNLINREKRKLYGTSAPEPSTMINYSPSVMDFNSMGSSLIKYMHQSFDWIKSSIDC